MSLDWWRSPGSSRWAILVRLILAGVFSRAAALPLIVIMIVAIISTKVPILLGHDWLIFKFRDLDTYSFWSIAHETRTDWAMLLAAIYVLVASGGRWPIDITRHPAQSAVSG